MCNLTVLAFSRWSEKWEPNLVGVKRRRWRRESQMTGSISVENEADKKKKSAVVRVVSLIRSVFVLLEVFVFSWGVLNGKHRKKQDQRGVIICCPCHWMCVFEGDCLCVLRYENEYFYRELIHCPYEINLNVKYTVHCALFWTRCSN